MKKNKLNIAPLLLLILSNIIGLIIIMLREENTPETVVLFAGICIVSTVVCTLLIKCDMGDPYLFLIATMLATIGIVILLSISELMKQFNENYGNFGIENMEKYLIGVALFFITILIYRLFYKYLAKFTPIYFVVMMSLYVMTKLFGTSNNSDAKNWLFGMQPTEFIKILLVLTIAGILTYTKKKDEKKAERIRYASSFGSKLAKKTNINRRIMLITAVVYLNMLFLLDQSELGTILVMFLTLIAFLFAYDKNKIFLLLNVVLFSVVAIVAINYIDEIADLGISAAVKIEGRIKSWLTPTEYNPRTKTHYGYQVLKSIRNIRNGGFVGTGIENAGASNGIIPFGVLHADFIFAAICNEMGIMGGVAVLLLYFVLVYRGFKIAISTTNEFNKAVAFGLSTMLGVQTFVIVGGVINLIPFTGITLPFVSHGGSSMMSTFIMLGMLQAISSVKGDTTDEIE